MVRQSAQPGPQSRCCPAAITQGTADRTAIPQPPLQRFRDELSKKFRAGIWPSAIPRLLGRTSPGRPHRLQNRADWEKTKMSRRDLCRSAPLPDRSRAPAAIRLRPADRRHNRNRHSFSAPDGQRRECGFREKRHGRLRSDKANRTRPWVERHRSRVQICAMAGRDADQTLKVTKLQSRVSGKLPVATQPVG